MEKVEVTLLEGTIHRLQLKPNEWAIIEIPEDSYADPLQLQRCLAEFVPPEMGRRMMIWYGELKIHVIGDETKK